MNTKKHNLLICPTCQENGGIRVLGEILDNGDFLIKRDRNAIRIRALHLQVICDQCGETVFVRREPMPIPRSQLYEDLFGRATL